MDVEARRLALRKLTNGMYLLTVSADGTLAASTVTWLSQCSFEPPLVMVGIKKTGETHAAIQRSGAFAVHVLAEGQKEIAEVFFKPPSVEEDRMNGLRYEPGQATGSPIFLELPAWFEARVTDAVERGDHTVFVAEVVNAGVREKDAKPLNLADTPWTYGG
jgi:flavin reductase (DIM6/NTAB) family NADH-FMN oxidoreductase RutF